MAGTDRLDQDIAEALERFYDLRADVRDLHVRARNAGTSALWVELHHAITDLGDELHQATWTSPGLPVDIDF